jgi:hypothetical protein
MNLRALDLALRFRAIMAELARVLDVSTFEPAKTTCSFAIAAVDYFTVAVGPALLAILDREAPGIRIVIVPPRSYTDRLPCRRTTDVQPVGPDQARPAGTVACA